VLKRDVKLQPTAAEMCHILLYNTDQSIYILQQHEVIITDTFMQKRMAPAVLWPVH